ncbi:cytochrome P450 [Striga asiatica]|uniref:Cytochrome P450 n=1 Tax=Striga asiatica TaxID=4170 RepID=A0A5A7Q7V6_STRAF|nr:cytochrome P450 [Striga asiatica]
MVTDGMLLLCRRGHHRKKKDTTFLRRRRSKALPLHHIHQRLVDLGKHVRRQVIVLPLGLLDPPVGSPVSVGGSSLRRLRRPALVLADLLEVPHEVVPLVIALILAPQAALPPAVVLHPLPPQLRRLAPLAAAGGFAQPSHSPLVVHSLGLDKDHRLLEVPVAFSVVPQHGVVVVGCGGGCCAALIDHRVE